MYHEVCMAVLPPHNLAETFRDWDEISEQLAEPSRKRPRYVYRYVNAYLGSAPPGYSPKTVSFDRGSERRPIFILMGWPQAHGHSVENHATKRPIAFVAACTPGRLSSPWVVPEMRVDL
jgi:hypothetical protein